MGKLEQTAEAAKEARELVERHGEESEWRKKNTENDEAIELAKAAVKAASVVMGQ